MTVYPVAKAFFRICPVFVLLFAASALHAQNGSLDASFGNNGKVITDFGGDKDYSTCMVLQPDNKIVVAGYVTLAAKQYFALARYKPNGTLDSSFGTNGKVLTGFDGITEVFLESIKLQNDGKIVAGGYLIDSANNNFALVRYKPDATLDSTFGTDGKIITDLTGNNNRSTSIEIEPDGTILVAGSINCNPAIRRYGNTGASSLFFADQGISMPDLGDCYNVNSMFLFATSQVLLTGEVDGSQDNIFLIVAGTLGNGGLDSSFGTNGVVKTSISDTSGVFASLVQPDGKIVVAGFESATSSNRQFIVARYKTTGVLDSAFGTNGEVRTSYAGSATAHSISLETNGNIVVTGSLNTGTADEIIWLMLDTNGKVDSTFGNNGTVVTPDGASDDAVASVIQPDGKLVVAGYTLSAGAAGYDFIVTRYNTSSSLPIKLSSFTASIIKAGVSVNWSTASEANSNYFLVERSGTATGFSSVGKVAAKGNTDLAQQYSFVDLQPLAGDNYYRLKQVDKDGKYSYSKIVHVIFGVSTSFIKAYPNPAKNTVQLSGLSTGATILVADMSGKTVLRSVATGSNQILNVQSLATGMYFIRVKQDDKIINLKLVKE